MSRSDRVASRDLAQAFRLIHDARDVGHDIRAWPQVLVAGLQQLIGARTVAMTYVELAAEGRPPRAELLGDVGWDDAAERSEWDRRFRQLQDFREDEIITRLFAGMGHLRTRSRDQLIGDTEWLGSVQYNELYRPFGLGDLLLSYARIESGRATIGFGMDRPAGSRPIGNRERTLLHIFHREVYRHLDRNLHRKPPATGPELPPRLRRTLDCLLEGETAGQVALRLGLSRHTINEYIADLYRRHEVRNRAELMALLLGANGPQS